MTKLIFLANLASKTAILGSSPNDDRIECDFNTRLNADGSLGFLVINGAWDGKLYETDKGFHLITGQGVRHEPIFVVKMIEPRPTPVDTEDDGIPY